MTLDEFCRAKAIIATHRLTLEKTKRALEACETAIKNLGGNTFHISGAIRHIDEAIHEISNKLHDL